MKSAVKKARNVRVKLEKASHVSPGVVSYPVQVTRGRARPTDVRADQKFARSLMKRLLFETREIQTSGDYR